MITIIGLTTTQEIQMKETWKETWKKTTIITINKITNKTSNKIQIEIKILTTLETQTTTTQEIIITNANIPIKTYKKVLLRGPFLMFKNNI